MGDLPYHHHHIIVFWEETKTITTTMATTITTTTKDASKKKKVHKGRKPGATQWTNPETTLLLTVVDTLCPAGRDRWAQARKEFVHRGNGQYVRTVDAMQRKFEKLAYAPTSTTTGKNTTEAAAHNVRAKQIKDKITAKERASRHTGNKNDDSNDDEKERQILNVVSPRTKKRKSTELMEAMDRYAETQHQSTKMFTTVLQELAIQETKSTELMEAMDRYAETQQESTKSLMTVLQELVAAAAVTDGESLRVAESPTMKRLDAMEGKLDRILQAIQQTNQFSVDNEQE